MWWLVKEGTKGGKGGMDSCWFIFSLLHPMGLPSYSYPPTTCEYERRRGFGLAWENGEGHFGA
jgi:hypothetical protein